MPQAADFQTTAQTDTVLVAAPGAGRAIEVLSVYVSVDTQMIVTFESGNSTRIHEQYAEAYGGHVFSLGNQPVFACAVNEALTYTSSAAGRVAVSVIYRINSV